MAEETLNVSNENPEENPTQGPVETRVHPREIMGDALPTPNAQTQKKQPVAQNTQATTRPQPKTQSLVAPTLTEAPVTERAVLMTILSGGSAVDTQAALTKARRHSGVSRSHDVNARMKSVAREALRTS